jgi:SAM-dependent methyltransferase
MKMTDKKLSKEIIQWDVRSWSKALNYWDEKIEWEKVHNALELGGNQGGLSLWLSLKGKTVVCSDLNGIGVAAENLHKRFNVDKLIKYQAIDATDIPYENHFDLIIFKSIIGGIGRNNNQQIQQKVFKEIHKALKPGGKLLFAENLIASPLHRWLRKKFINWGSSWRYVSKDEMKEFLKDFSFVEIKSTGVLATFGRNEKQRDFLAFIDKALLNKLCPDKWKYITYGIAEK